MAIFTAIAAAVVTALGITGTAATIFTAIGSTLLSVGASRLLMKRQTAKSAGGGAGGARIQLPPATENKLPVIYGSAFVGGSVTDAKISSDNKTMWYCVAMAEVTDTGSYTFDTNNIYYNGLKVNFGANGVVTGLVNNTTPPTTDTKMSGQINIYLFQNGANTPGQNTSFTAQQIMQDSQIPAGQRWTSTDLMTDCAFAIIKVQYNAEKGTTSLGGVTAKLTNSLSAPGSCIKDYMENTRYGCAIPTDQIDTASLTALDTYSAETINYGTGTQQRYRLDGPLATGNDCLTNLQIMVDSTDSWLQYNEFVGKWSVIINRSYTDYTTISALFLVDSSNLVGGIDVAPINLNETYNQLEVAYPNASIRDQTDYQLIKLEDYFPGVMSPNEATNKLDVDYPIVNNSVQSIYLGVRRLLQGREDLTVTFQLDYSGIQVQAGDVIRIKQEVYGWDTLNLNQGKLFRVANVSEEKYQDGSLGVRITAFEYNDTIYADRAILDFQPDPNLGIVNPNIIDTPVAPRVLLDDDGSVAFLNIVGIVPQNGLVNYLDFQYGTDSDPATHSLYATADNGDGAPLTSVLGTDVLKIGQTYSIRALGTTNWASVGASVVDLSTQPALGGFIQPGKEYIISSAGTTDFTLSGAPNNLPGTTFIANRTVLAQGTGVAILTDFVATGTDAGTGVVDTAYAISMNDLPPDTYYWSVRAKNDQVGVTGPSSDPIVWAGPTVTKPKQFTLAGVTNVSNVLTLNLPPSFGTTDDICIGGFITVVGGDGAFAANSFVTQINSLTEFETNVAPSPNLTSLADGGSSVLIDCVNYLTGDSAGGIPGSDIQDGTIEGDKFAAGLSVGTLIAQHAWAVQQFIGGIPTYVPIVVQGINEPSAIVTTSAIPSTEYYPFYQGTSSTANGYDANSTSPFQPFGASRQTMVNGTDEWYILNYNIVQQGFKPNVDSVNYLFTTQVVADADCTLQFQQFLTVTSAKTTLITNTQQGIQTFQLEANKPQMLRINDKFGVIGGNGYAVGGCWRVLEAGPIVSSIYGLSQVYVERG